MDRASSPDTAERVARIEGSMEQMSLRLNRVTEEIDSLRRALESKVDKWEVRIWFLILMAFMAALQLL